MTIRTATVNDLEFIRHCAAAAYEKYIERIGKPPAPMVADFSAAICDGTVALCLQDQSPVGFVIFYPVDAEMHLENVAVLPELCGRGFGRALISYVEQKASAQGMSSVYLYTNEAMTENIGLYPALGYQEFKRCTESGFRRVYFRKQLP